MKKVFYLMAVLGLLSLGTVLTYQFYQKPDVYSFEDEIAQKKLRKQNGEPGKKMEKIKGFQDYMKLIHVPYGMKESPAPGNYIMEEYKKVTSKRGRSHTISSRSFDKALTWIERGPANVGGRTRGLLVDPDDSTHMTWYAGSASGGAWKTTDGGKNWRCLTNDLPIMTTTTLEMAKSNPDVIYMGSGETSTLLPGGGLFRSTDKGETWEYLESTFDNFDFRYINRIVVDPSNDSIVLVATDEGILKSSNAGQSWARTYYSDAYVEDLVADTSDFNYMFAGVNGVGVVRSTDAGETWENITSGIGERNRIELAISPSNPMKVYASVETADGVGALYSSWDRGDSWELVADELDNGYSLHGGQGEYDNTIAVHPYDENTVFFGGVNLWKATVSAVTQEGEGTVSTFDTTNTASFLTFVSFTGNLYPGMNTGDNEEATDLTDTDFVSVEIRFGPGLSQKAHRFFVPEQATSGVPASDYTYQDYIDVPFQVWDVTNNKQLMVSFRDQERDGEFNLYERTSDDYGELGREYIYINAVDYDPDNPDPNIAQQAGRAYKNIYFFWPNLIEGGTWDPENLPESNIYVEWYILQERLASLSSVADAYGAFDGPNRYNFLGNRRGISGLHPDHHELLMIPVDDEAEEFWVLNGNDGGLGISYDGGNVFTQIYRKYHTTQFYGVGKKPYRNEYIGGMQDNGTWRSPTNIDATTDTAFTVQFGGDGLEVIWHKQDSNRLMGAVQYGPIRRSLDHGETWTAADNGLGELPFVVRLSPLPSNNNYIFTVCSEGVYRTGNFGTTNWRLTAIEEGWLSPLLSSVTSSHRVEVSPANEEIVWAGAGMSDLYDFSLFVSTDQGDSFTAVNFPDNPVPTGLSGLVAHPTEDSTAYALYSAYGYPKILRTEDLGNTWEDITQFEGDTSANGFPNVGANDLLIWPETPDTIWAATQIGIMESLDNGATWHYLESELPAVPIEQIFIQDNQVVLATYGRGIWTWQFGPELEPPVVIGPDATPSEPSIEFSLYPNPVHNQLTIALDEPLADAILSIYTLQGKLVLDQKLTSSSGKHQVNVSELQPGNYILTLSAGGKQYSERLVVQ